MSEIKKKINDIHDAIDEMDQSNESGSGFAKLKKAVVDRIHETEKAADVMLGLNKADVSGEIREKMKEIGDATEVMLHMDDTHASKEIGRKIKKLIKEIYDAYDVMVFNEKPKK